MPMDYEVQVSLTVSADSPDEASETLTECMSALAGEGLVSAYAVPGADVIAAGAQSAEPDTTDIKDNDAEEASTD